ncbi:MAG: hypothetical protein HY331_08950 [Chloroflexi bacterium]|nr:hypothetical protein [Chloroflexota bacterium]
MPSRTKRRIALAAAAAVGLAILGLVVATRPPWTAEVPHLISMAESAGAMRQAGAVMQAHGEAMRAEGWRREDLELIAQAERWRRDGQALALRAQWLTVDPTAPANLISTPGELAAQGNLGILIRASRAMVHDPSRVTTGDLDALRWNGLAMRAEGRQMAEHGRTMAELVAAMGARHDLSGQAAVELRQAAWAVTEAGDHLAQNGRNMVDYVDRFRRSLGYQ